MEKNKKSEIQLLLTPPPHIKAEESVRGLMSSVIIALIPTTIIGIYFFGIPSIVTIFVAAVSSILFEFFYQKIVRKENTISDSSAALTGLLLGLNLPAGFPWWGTVIGSFIAIVVVKHLFGGLGFNIFNPALAARVFLLISWPLQMSTYPKPASIFSGLAVGYLGMFWVLAIAIVTVLGPGLTNALLAIGIVSIPSYARVVRASVLSVREMDYVSATRALGGSNFDILFRRILPNAMTPLIVQGTLGIATAILDAAALSFLGLGAQPPMPEWGSMLGSERNQVFTAPHLVFYPGFAIMLTVLSFNLLGDTLRDIWDPRLRGSQ